MELEREILAIPWSGKITLHANQSSVHGSKASLQVTFVHSTPAWHVVCNVRPVCVRMCVGYVCGLCVWAMCVGYVCGLCVWAMCVHAQVSTDYARLPCAQIQTALSPNAVITF